MRIILSAFILAGGVSCAQAGCSVDVFEKNGFYYSETGNPEDAYRMGRLKLPPISKKSVEEFTALKGSLDRDYSPDGKFFLRSGVGGKDFIVILPPDEKKQEAVLVRRVSRTTMGETPEYVSISRSDIAYASCQTNSDSEQQGLSADRHFVDTNTYLLAHSDERELARTPLLKKKFHFFFKGNRGCKNTANVVDENGRERMQEAYTGLPQGTKIGQKGGELIEQTTYSVAQVFLPSPAYASLPSDRSRSNKRRENPRRISTGVEVGLYDMSDRMGVCLEIPAPVPTGKLAKGWFRSFADPKAAAVRAAKRGDWRPEVTEFHFQQVDNHKQSALIRLTWN